MVVTVSHQGYIKRIAVSTYRRQRRGGRGLNGMAHKEEDWVEHLFIASTHDYVMFFTQTGQVYWLKVYDIPQMGRAAKGKPIINSISLKEGEAAFLRKAALARRHGAAACHGAHHPGRRRRR